MRPPLRVLRGKPFPRHRTKLAPLARADGVEGAGGSGAAAGDTRLHLTEDETARVGGDDVQLAVAGAVVAREDEIPRAREMLSREALRFT